MVSAVLWCVSAVCTQAADYDQFSLKVGESTFTYTVTSEADTGWVYWMPVVRHT